MIERFIPISPRTESELAQQLQSHNPYASSLPYFPEDMHDRVMSFSPTPSANHRFNWPPRSFRSKLWSSKFLLWNERPLHGSMRKLPRKSLVVVQGIESPRELEPVDSLTFVGIIPRKSLVTEVLEFRHDKDKQLAVQGLFSYLNSKKLDVVTDNYKETALDLETLITDRWKKYHREKANRLVTPDLLQSIPRTVHELDEVWTLHENTKHRPGSTAAEKQTANDFFDAMHYIGISGMSDSLRQWHEWAYSRGKSYNKEHDIVTQQRLDTLHTDHDAILETVAQEGRFFSYDDYAKIDLGRAWY